MASGRALDTYRFLVVGKSGAGKSSTANTILGESKFPTGTGVSAVTINCEYRKVLKKKYAVEIVDSPGLFDPVRDNKEIMDEIVKTTAALDPGPHAVLYILKLDRYTPEEFETFKRLKQLFDENIVKFTIIVYTGGDKLKQDKQSLDDILGTAGPNLQQVLKECGHRVIIFNNSDSKKNKEAKVNELLSITEKIYKENEESPYRCTVQKTVGDKLKETVTLSVQEQIENDPKLKLFFSEMERKIREMGDRAGTHEELMKHSFVRKRELEEALETVLKDREQREREEEERRKDEEKLNTEEETKKEVERKTEERKKKEEERFRFEVEKEKLRLEKEAWKEKQEAEKARREEEKLMRQQEAKLEEKHKEELERKKEEIASDGMTGWVQDVAGVLWKGVKGWIRL